MTEIDEFTSMQDLLSTLDTEIAALESSEADSNVSTLQAMLDGLDSTGSFMAASESSYPGYQRAMEVEDYQSSVADLLAAADAHEQRLAHSGGGGGGGGGGRAPPLLRGPTLSALEAPPSLSAVDLSALVGDPHKPIEDLSTVVVAQKSHYPPGHTRQLSSSSGSSSDAAPPPILEEPPPLDSLEHPPSLGFDGDDLKSNEMLAALLKDLEDQGSGYSAATSPHPPELSEQPPVLSEPPPPMLHEAPPPLLSEPPPPMLSEPPPFLDEEPPPMLNEPPPTLGSLDSYRDVFDAADAAAAIVEAPAYDAPAPPPPAGVASSSPRSTTSSPSSSTANSPTASPRSTNDTVGGVAAAGAASTGENHKNSSSSNNNNNNDDDDDDDDDDSKVIALDENWVLPESALQSPQPWMQKNLQKVAKAHQRQSNELMSVVEKTRAAAEKTFELDMQALDKQKQKDDDNNQKEAMLRRKTLSATQLAAQKALLKELAIAFKEKAKTLNAESKAWLKEQTNVLKEEVKLVAREYKKDKATRKAKCLQLTEAAKLRTLQYQELRDLDAKKWAGLEKESRQHAQQQSQLEDEIITEQDLLDTKQSLEQSQMGRIHTTTFSYLNQQHESYQSAQSSLPLQAAQLTEQQELDVELLTREHEIQTQNLHATIQKEHALALKAFEKRMKGRTKNFSKEMKGEKKTRKVTMTKTDIRDYIAQKESTFKVSVDEEFSNFHNSQKTEEESRKLEQKEQHEKELAALAAAHQEATAGQNQRHEELRDALARKIRVELRRLKIKQHKERMDLLERHHVDQQKLLQVVYTKRKNLLTAQCEAAVKLAEEHRKEFVSTFQCHNKALDDSPHVEITDEEDQRVDVVNNQYDLKINDIKAEFEGKHQELDASHAEAFKALESKQRVKIDAERRVRQEIE
eukprot:CAMPEP_0177647618 /NCGR_PEP_ID=MMETSP0447-20121125/10395_1 /TAXON_ID=0 /ORGANISM="Stygamoeba regulata, Strain BSH-02190019" /LENGTH=912 /DNA_ID=CAMNT_0019150213 /DNA_START=281 /DNA_END=3019 /DNA_ORIENTATION=-